MKYSRFEELPVWQAAKQLALDTFRLTGGDDFSAPYALKDQLQRAALSVSNNIAEGFERGTNQELIAFLYIARGSAGESRSMLTVLAEMPECKSLESGVLNLRSRAESISRQLGAWITSLKNSDRKGQRFATEKTKREQKAAEDRKAFVSELKRFRENA